MREIEFKLSKKGVVTSEDKAQQEKLFFIPTDPETAKKVKLIISQKVNDHIIEDMGLPVNIGDKVLVEFGATNKQTKLTKPKGAV